MVLKEAEEPNYYEMLNGMSDMEIRRPYSLDIQMRSESSPEFDGFKMIMYFCKRHENEFKYLIRGSELRISKECRLHAPKIRAIK